MTATGFTCMSAAQNRPASRNDQADEMHRASAESALGGLGRWAEAANLDEQESASAESPLGPNVAGWDLVSATATKVWLTLAGLGRTGSSTTEAIAEASGLGKRTVSGALAELVALGWLHLVARRGQGIAWRLLSPPESLAESATQYYRDRLQRAQARLLLREERLLHAERAAREPTAAEGEAPMAEQRRHCANN